jgi:hypothetical protein
MNTSIKILVAAFFMQWLIGCATEPPPLAPKNPANPQLLGSSRTPPNVLVRDETTLAIEKELSATESNADAADTMKHDMQNMPGMKMEQHNHMKNKEGQ